MPVRVYSTFIAMVPRGKQRPRIVSRPNMPYPVAITPDETVVAENRIQAHVQGEWRRPPLENPLQVQIVVRLQKPKSAPKKRVIWPTSKPDADNYAKLLLDALNGVLWKDDSQVTRLFVEKAWCDPAHPNTGFSLSVTALDQDLEALA